MYDPTGMYTVDLGGGWTVRIDSANTNTLTQKHIHLLYKGKVKYSQNNDGSPHDGSKGTPSNSVLKKLKKETGWDWKAKALKYDANPKTQIKSVKNGYKIYYLKSNGKWYFGYDSRLNYMGYGFRRIIRNNAGREGSMQYNNYNLYFMPSFAPIQTPSFNFNVNLIPSFS